MKTEVPRLSDEQIATWQRVVEQVRRARKATQPTEWVYHPGKRKLDPSTPVDLSAFLRGRSLQRPAPNLARLALFGFIAGAAILAVAALFHK